LTKPVRRPIVPQIIAICTSLLALAAMLNSNLSYLTNAEIVDMALPHGYSLLLRVVLCASCAYLAFRAAEASKRDWVWILGATAFVYNPVIPLQLGREIWSVVLVITVIILVATFWTLRT
jgi:hypothetical protein